MVDKTAHSSLDLRGKYSFSFDPIQPKPKVFNKSKNFLNLIFLHIKMDLSLNITPIALACDYFLENEASLMSFSPFNARLKSRSYGKV